LKMNTIMDAVRFFDTLSAPINSCLVFFKVMMSDCYKGLAAWLPS
jgi:hypothetical protein